MAAAAPVVEREFPFTLDLRKVSDGPSTP
jgi:hypothetical protein